jgi:SAM-dependent methyltransferase
MLDRNSISSRAKALGPWLFDFELAPGLWTKDCNRQHDLYPYKQNVELVNPLELLSFFNKYYPSGLAGKDVLDITCNSGAYCFLAHELGARSAKGVDVRERWLEQARFIKSLKYPKAITVSFSNGDPKVYFKKTKRRFDIVIFRGILYRLPDPIHALMGYCDLAKETILVESDCVYDIRETCFVALAENHFDVMSGADGLAWLPGGPRAVQQILRYKGFKRVDIEAWHGVAGQANLGQMRIVGSR